MDAKKYHAAETFVSAAGCTSEEEAAFSATQRLNVWLEDIEREWNHVEVIDIHTVVSRGISWTYWMSIVVVYWND